MKVFDVRLVLEDDVDTDAFLHACAMGTEGDLLGAVELTNNGFGNIGPEGELLTWVTREHRDPVLEALRKGEV